jgi:hypothetical protein
MGTELLHISRGRRGSGGDDRSIAKGKNGCAGPPHPSARRIGVLAVGSRKLCHAVADRISITAQAADERAQHLSGRRTLRRLEIAAEQNFGQDLDGQSGPKFSGGRASGR